MFAPYCTPEQVGVMFMLMNKHCPEALEFNEEGGVKISMEMVPDQMLDRLLNQLDMWGIGYVPIKKR